jgi:hypothetical protein
MPSEEIDNKTLDMGMKVKMEDGKELSIAELVAKASTADKLKSQNEELSELVEATKFVFHEETGPEVRAAAIQHLLAHHGYTEEQIADYLEQNGADAVTNDGSSDEVPPESAVDDSLKEEIKELQGIVAGLQQKVQETRGKALENHMVDQIKAHMAQDEGLKALLSAGAKRGDDGRRAAEATLAEMMRKRALEGVVLRRQQGRMVNEQAVAESVKEAAKSVSDAYRSVIGDVNQLGKSPETVSATESVLKDKFGGKPVAFPTYDEKKPVGEVEQQADLAMESHLLQILRDVEQSEVATSA